ncbi:MAG: phthiocerol/phthiodiolone dimycocerosyl transferase family protein [Segniliparus sp.]|uniref:phthiocerol/phthiodiolone dimycocerosyl transferase family protein n=1 Tax=Segniliparus sp. TaxID=2804064 RepID=UPI003F328A20
MALRARPSRLLTPSESVSAPARNTIRFAAHCSGNLDIDALQRAWRLVCQENPGLAGAVRLAQDANDRYAFYPDIDRAGLVVCTDIPPQGGNLTAHRTLDDLDAAAALEVATGRNGHVVSLLMRHSIADGRLGVYALRRIWEIYCDLVESDPRRPTDPVAESPTTARPLEELLKEHATPLGPPCPMPARTHPAGVKKHLVEALSGLRHGQFSLCRATTAALLDRCARDSTSVHGILAACALTALARYSDGSHSIALTSVIDVRPHMTPTVRAPEGTYTLGFATTALPAADADDLLLVAERVLSDIGSGLASGAVQRSSIGAATTESALPAPMMLSNLGAIAPFPTPAGLTVDDFSFWNEMDLSNPGGVGLCSVYGNMGYASSYNGRLRVDLFHGVEMFDASWTQNQIKQIESLLHQYALASLVPSLYQHVD